MNFITRISPMTRIDGLFADKMCFRPFLRDCDQFFSISLLLSSTVHTKFMSLWCDKIQRERNCLLFCEKCIVNRIWMHMKCQLVWAVRCQIVYFDFSAVRRWVRKVNLKYSHHNAILWNRFKLFFAPTEYECFSFRCNKNTNSPDSMKNSRACFHSKVQSCFAFFIYDFSSK